MITGGQVNAVPEPGESAGGEGASAAAWTESRSPRDICHAYGSDFEPPAPLDKVAVALATLDLPPLNARRVSPERGTCGWYIWGGEGAGRSRTPGFFQTLQVAHLVERCPQIIPFLALAPGWRVRLDGEGPEITPPHALPPPDNVAVRRIGSRTARPQSVKHWVWLSILLHILAVALFGDTVGGGSRRGDRPGGPLNVTLQKKSDGATAPTLRTDSRLRSLERREGVALLGAPTAAGAPPPAAQEERPAAPVLPPVIATEVTKPVTDFVVPLETQAAPEAPVAPAPRLLEPLPKLDAIAAPKALDAPNSERNITLPAELIPRLVPLVPARPERDTTVPLDPAPRARTFVAPRVETPAAPAAIIAPPPEIPRVTPLAPLAPPTIERDAVVRPADMLPRLPPVTPSAALETATPTAEMPRLPPAPAIPAAATAPAATTVPVAGERPPDSTRPPVTTAPSATTAAPPSLPSASRVTPGVPAGDALPADTLTPRAAIPPSAATPGSATPRIDLDAVRQRAREIAREGSGPRTLLPFNVRPKLDTRTNEQKAFDKALKRADCRDAYSAMGLAAVVPLLLDSVSEKGCKW